MPHRVAHMTRDVTSDASAECQILTVCSVLHYSYSVLLPSTASLNQHERTSSSRKGCRAPGGTTGVCLQHSYTCRPRLLILPFASQRCARQTHHLCALPRNCPNIIILPIKRLPLGWLVSYIRRMLVAFLSSSRAGNTVFAAITAIVAANLVLVAYIIESVREESRAAARERQQAESKKNK